MKTKGVITGLSWVLLLSGAVTVQGATTYSAAVLKDGPLAYWSFDESGGAGVQQAPLVQHPVAAANDLVPVQGGVRASHARIGSGLTKLGNAAEFSGTNHFRARALRTGKTALTGAYAIEFWMQVIGANSSDRADYIVNVGDNAPGVIYDFKPDQLELYAGSRTDNGPVVGDGGWHHVLFVYYGDGSDGVEDRVDAYLDGVAHARIGNQFSKRMDLSRIVVGAATSAGSNGFEGRLDELAIYDLGGLPDGAAVSSKVSSLVARHLAGARGGDEPYASMVKADRPLLYWTFDETDGDAKQMMEILLPVADNSRNDLEPRAGAARIAHEAARSGLLLGNAIDLDGEGGFFGRTGGLDLGIPAVNGPWAVEFWFQLKGEQKSRYFLNLGSASSGYNSPAIIYGYFGPTVEVYGAGAGRSGSKGVPVTDRNWHHMLVVHYDSGPGGSVPGPQRNRVDLYLDNVPYTDVGGDFSKSLDLGDWLFFGSAVESPDPAQSGSVNARLDELALYDLGGTRSVEEIAAKTAGMAASHYAAAFGGVSVGTIRFQGQPADVVARVDGPVRFSVAATVSGTSSPLAYQWQRNEVNLDGATNAVLEIPSATINDIGTNQYRVRVSAGPVFKFSDTAVLVVDAPAPPPPTFYSQVVLGDGPTLYWNFDELVGDAVQLAPLTALPVTTENDLVATGSARRRINHAGTGDGLANLGRAVALDGASFLQAANPRFGRQVVDNAFALEMWLRLDGGANEYIANFGGPGADNSPALIHDFIQPGYLELYGPGGRVGKAGPQVNDTRWHHVVWVVYNNLVAGRAGRVDVYLDGVLKPDVGSGFGRNLDLRGVILGASLPGGQNAMAGALDEFAAYDFAGMTVAQVAEKAASIATNHFAAGLSPLAVDYTQRVLADKPVLYYNFEETDGDAVQRAPVTIHPPDNSANILVNRGAKRIEHHRAGSGLGLGNAADFDGLSYFRAAALQAPKSAIPAPWALEFWFQAQGANSDNRQDYLVNFDNAPGFIYDFKPDELEVYAGVRTDGGPVVGDQQWHHVVWVFYGDGTVGVADRADAYLDGVPVSGIRNTFSGRINLGGPVVVGAAQPGYNGFQGRVDELALYDFSALVSEAAVTSRVSSMVSGHLAAAKIVIPVLNVSRAGEAAVLSWTGSGFVLQQSMSLSTKDGWVDVAGGASGPVTIPIEHSGNRFFRLVKR